MLKIENALLLDICLGYPLGKIWFPSELPDPVESDIPNTFILKGKQLAGLKILAERSDSRVVRALDTLQSRADLFMATQDISVTQKQYIKRGITINDYVSLAKYSWPNPDTSNGLPYVHRDGEVNPECYSSNYDINRLESFSEATLILSLTAYLTDNRSYASKASQMLRTWLIEPATRQTPHFQYAQITPGLESEERYQGLIEARRMIYVCEAIQILKHIRGISEDDYNEYIKWFEELLSWFETSKKGLKAKEATNNIGIWYELQRLVYALFTGKKDSVNSILTGPTITKISKQIGEDGRLNRELKRKKPYDYVAFTLLALAGLESASKHGEIKLERYSGEEGRSFQNAFNWLNSAFDANDLQDKSLALGQLVINNQEIAELKETNHSLRVALENIKSSANQDNNTSLISKDTLNLQAADLKKSTMERLSSKLKLAEKEISSLQFKLDNKIRSNMITTMFYSGVELLMKEQSNKIKLLESEQSTLCEEKQLLLDELDMYKKQIADLKNLYAIEQINYEKLDKKHIELQQNLIESKSDLELMEKNIKVTNEKSVEKDLLIKEINNNYLIEKEKNQFLKEQAIWLKNEIENIRNYNKELINKNQEIQMDKINLNNKLEVLERNCFLLTDSVQVLLEKEQYLYEELIDFNVQIRNEKKLNQKKIKEYLNNLTDLNTEKEEYKELANKLQKDKNEKDQIIRTQLEVLSRTLEEKQLANKRYETMIRRRKSEIKKVQENYRKINKEKKTYEIRYRLISESRSWRYTLPIRKTLDGIKKLKKRTTTS